MPPRRQMRKWYSLSTFKLSLGISILIFGLFVLKEERGWDFGLFDLMELKVLDIKFHDRGPKPEHGQVVIAAIDEKSLVKYGRWPWNRIYVAQLLQTLAEGGASVVAFDIAFSDPDQTQIPVVMTELAKAIKEIEVKDCPNCEPMRKSIVEFLTTEAENSDPDKILAETIKEAKNAVLGVFVYNDPNEVRHIPPEQLKQSLACVKPSKINIIKPWDKEEEKDYRLLLHKGLGLLSPMPIFCAASKTYGHLSFQQDDDGELRWADLVQEVETGDPNVRYFLPSLSLKASAMYLRKEIVMHTYPRGVDKVSLGLGEGSHEIPTDFLGRLLINYHGPAQSFPTYSVADILDGSVPPKAYENKIVLIGATATGVYDLRVIPFQKNFPGVEVHANIIDNILNHNYISRPDWAVYGELGLILFFGLFLGIVLKRLSAMWGALMIMVVMSSYYLIDKHFVFANGYWIRMVLPMSQAFLVFFVCYVHRYITEEREKKRTRDAFKQYLNESVVNELMNDYDKLKLGGEKREITVLFSDIRGFTSVSEKLTPDELGTMLTEYLNPMTQTVFDHEGVLDKYMGDAIMAFWGAPHPQKDHAIRACRTALAMRRKLEELNALWTARGITNLNIGIGVSTGPMWVGNMGSDVRFDYTVIGDSVNLGSRLEGTNKEYGTCVIISEMTYRVVTEQVICRQLDSIRVKGKAQPVVIYELLGEGTGTDDQRRLVETFEKGLNAYRAQKWDEAVAQFNACLEQMNGRDEPSRVFIRRCEEYRNSPPSPDWDGVYTMTHK